MRRLLILILVSALGSCELILEPKPTSLLVDDLALNEAADVPSARIGLYSALRSFASSKVLAGDFTADMLVHNGTFSQYRELGSKQITPANATAASLWGGIYGSVYVANFILERLPAIGGLPESYKAQVLAEAHFVRGYAYMVGYYTFGEMPLVTTTDVEANSNIPRSSANLILDLVEEDFISALDALPETVANPGFLARNAAKAALARFYLYEGDYATARTLATEVIESGEYELEQDFLEVVYTDFTDEAILEMGYTVNDDPGTSATGLNNLFVGRREIIPSNQVVVALSSNDSGDRFGVLSFDFNNLGGSDNGWSVAKYGTPDENNNNIILFRLAEMFLIRAESNVALGELQAAEEDINLLRERANAPLVIASSKTQMEGVVERERLYELAYEGHRWYDLKRTGRISTVMNAFSSNWRAAFELWPIPEREIQNNPALSNSQNPGY